MQGLPCLGAVDGMHVASIRPLKSGTIYFNYKKFFSIVLLAVSDTNYQTSDKRAVLVMLTPSITAT